MLLKYTLHEYGVMELPKMAAFLIIFCSLPSLQDPTACRSDCDWPLPPSRLYPAPHLEFLTRQIDCILMYCVNTEPQSAGVSMTIPVRIYSKPPFSQSFNSYLHSEVSHSCELSLSAENHDVTTTFRIYGSQSRTDARCSFSTNSCLLSQQIPRGGWGIHIQIKSTQWAPHIFSSEFEGCVVLKMDVCTPMFCLSKKNVVPS